MNETILGTQVGVSAIIVYLIQLAKSTNFPWFSAHSDALNRITSVVMAFLTSAGIVFLFHGDLISGGTLMITIPPLTVWTSAVIHGFGQVAIQEGVYKSTVKPKL
jgi:hypothetical protein